MSRAWRIACVSILLNLAWASPSAADDMAPGCSNGALTEAVIEEKLQTLLSLEKVRQWERRLPLDVHMTAIPGENRTGQNGECYSEVTLYEMHADHMTLWHTFLLGAKRGFVANLDGDWVPINSYERW
ncbi:MAG: hypothetical protein FD119_1706 [Stygiobacter sp.]|nr:MAG: hypothetical protein FD119_1706 [Stygiobacter sp.]